MKQVVALVGRAADEYIAPADAHAGKHFVYRPEEDDDEREREGDVEPADGALVTALLFTIGKFAIGAYLCNSGLASTLRGRSSARLGMTFG